MRTIINGLLVVALLLVGPAAARGAADEYERSIRAFLKDNFDQKPECMVVGLIDADGVRIYSAGNLGEGKDRPADGDTLFEIGSCTKTFTALLLLEMAERGEVKLDDPVAKYLPEGVQVPARNGKRITLLNLALQDSGLTALSNELPLNPRDRASCRRNRSTSATTSTAWRVTPPTSIPTGEPRYIFGERTTLPNTPSPNSLSWSLA